MTDPICPFEKKSHKEFFFKTLQNQTNPAEILTHCTAFTTKQSMILTQIKVFADEKLNMAQN